MAGVYVHIPFCSSFCIYCDFYSVLDRRKLEIYVEALCDEIYRKKDFFKEKGCPLDQVINTIYFGGGTPSLLPIPLLEKIVIKIKEVFLIQNTIDEFTIEVNPDDITSFYASELLRIGVNRVSMGVQSFNDNSLKWMNRRHSSSQAVEAFRVLREVGFKNISVDLIFGYTADGNVLKGDIDKLLELSPEHISVYQLGVEPETSLSEMLEEGEYKELSSEACAMEYSYVQKRLLAGGWYQYEVSSFSRNGFNAQHNSSYWERIPYLGIGAAAHSFISEKRLWNISDIDEYIKGEVIIEFEDLTTENIINEIIMVGLRRVKGFNIDELPFHSSIIEIEKNIEKLVQKGLLIQDARLIKIPLEKLFISDYIISQI